MTCANCGRSRGTTVTGCICIPNWFWNEPQVSRAVVATDAAEVIRQLRRRVPGLKQWAIARMCGVHQSTISRVERGRPLDRNLAHTALEGLGARERTHDASRPDLRQHEPVVMAVDRMDLEQERTHVRDLLAHAAQVTVGAGDIDPRTWAAPLAAFAPSNLPRRITTADVQQIEAVTQALRAADYQFGSGACLDAIIGHLHHAQQFLGMQMSEQVSRQMYRALADLHNLAGWTCFDAGQYRAARGYFSRALEQAQHVGEPSLVANILYRMGRLHLHRDMPAEALRFLQLGQIAAQDSGCQLTVALLCANEGWAYAVAGDVARSRQSLGRAEDEFARADPNRAPAWIGFFQEADLDALTGVACAALPSTAATYDEATTRLRRAVAVRGQQMSRSQAFELTALATAHIMGGDADEGITVAHRAIHAATTLRSTRVVDRLEPLRRAAHTHRSNSDLAEVATAIARLRSP